MSTPRRLPVLVAILAVVLTACGSFPGGGSAERTVSPLSRAAAPAPARADAVCDDTEPGPAAPPPDAVSVDPEVGGDLVAKTEASPAGTTFWLASGTHTLGEGRFDQVAPKDGNVYVGAPGAVIDGHGLNQYAFVGDARDVTISHVTVRGFVAPQDQGVVNHDSGDGWVIEHSTIEENAGAGLMAGAYQQVRHNCLRNNGQYGMNAYAADDAIVDLVVEGNEVVGNNTGDWETRSPGCGCSGGIKFWSVDGAVIRDNWVHENRGVGLWADTNNNDFLFERNLIEDNDSMAIFYETSYNAVIRSNTIRRNAWVSGREFAEDRDGFPVAAIYISEAGGDPRVEARTDRIEIYDNLLVDNWSGITLWENADRFCGSAANTSVGVCTLVQPAVERCAQPGIAREPLYSDCRWKTQRVDIHDNWFAFDPEAVGCTNEFCGRMALLSNFGTYPEWSPYSGSVVQDAITFGQDNRWRDNTYVGPWRFTPREVDQIIGAREWQARPFQQDAGSVFMPAADR